MVLIAKLVNTLQITVFVKSGEDLSIVMSKLKEIVPFDFKKEKIKIEETNATGVDENPIKIIRILLLKGRLIKPFIELMKNNLSSDQKKLILKQINSRLDENMDFFIRLDKDKLLNGEYFLTDGGNCFHFKMNIACFPKKRINAEIAIREIFA
ncbi:RNA-binding domain-containing protein [Nanoarchaeota archaeon]